MKNAYIIDAVRTPFGRYAGGLAPVRADDLGAVPIRALMERNPAVDWKQADDVIYGCANQAGEDNRNVGRMSALLAGLPHQVPATTVNRLCGSSLDAVAMAARAIKAGEAHLIIAGGVESMSRAPLVMGKSETAYGRSQKLEDTTMGWRFINPKLKEIYGVETMPQTAENVAEQFGISRADQDKFALESQKRTAAAQQQGFFAKEITPVAIPQRKGEAVIVDTDEHPRPDGYVIHDVRHVHVDHLAGRLVAAVRAAHGDTVARPEIDAVAVLVGDRRDTDFGALRIYHDRDSRVNAVYGLDNMRSALFRDMRRIDTNHVHTGIEKVFHELFGATEIRHCCDDLGFFHSIHTSMMLKY